METFIKVLIACGIAFTIAFTLAAVSFLVWTAIFYPYVKKFRIDDLIKDQHAELEEIRVKKVDEYEAVNKLLVDKAKLQAEIAEIKAENDKLLAENEELKKS